MAKPFSNVQFPPINGISDVSTFIASTQDSYPSLCLSMALLMSKSGLSKDDLFDALSDLSDLLDGLPPSSRSGFISSEK